MELVFPHVLSEQQKRVVISLTRGTNLKETAKNLQLRPKTVEYHWVKARQRIGIWDLASLVHWALAVKLIEPIYKAEFVEQKILVPTNIVQLPKTPIPRRKRRDRSKDKYAERTYSIVGL